MSEQTELKIDRTGWGPGPWDGEPDKLTWKTEAGLPGMIVRNRLGGLCGYVAVTKEHPLFAVEYNAGEWPNSPEARFSVHGGLTYSDKCSGNICHVPEPGEPDDVWWFGFDCVHSGDLAPYSTKYEGGPWYGDEYRTIDYVRGEVEDLARQLAEAGRG